MCGPCQALPSKSSFLLFFFAFFAFFCFGLKRETGTDREKQEQRTRREREFINWKSTAATFDYRETEKEEEEKGGMGRTENTSEYSTIIGEYGNHRW